MPVRESEALILRSFPLGEADRLVSFLSRSPGRMREAAARAGVFRVLDGAPWWLDAGARSLLALRCGVDGSCFDGAKRALLRQLHTAGTACYISRSTSTRAPHGG